MLEDLKLEDVEALAFYPQGTEAYQREVLVAQMLLAACKSVGYGRAAQMMNLIEQMWRGKITVDTVRAERDEFVSVAFGKHS